ncbi:VPLPA-CTERM sorting domain-containing protein [Rhodovulum sp. P5]|uniref:VPLPA-CTERM sorting domain-containing protein n=1 Tax=Rhodovulum sp. P5 TaxID=1564506 RepID=UPI00155F68F3|nr:VPLPA-CTERM sorting domain-containing protein [Rhodovulum sp. P5]
MDFTGTAHSLTGNFATAPDPDNIVTGRFEIDLNATFSADNDPFLPLEPGNRDRKLGLINITEPAGLNATRTRSEITLNGITSTSRPLIAPNTVDARINFRAIDDNPTGPNDTFSYIFLDGVDGFYHFTFEMQSENLIGADPSLGFSFILMNSLDLSDVEASRPYFGNSVFARGFFESADGFFAYDLTGMSVSLEEVAPVPVPAGLPLALTGLGALAALRRREAGEAVTA